MKLIIRLLVTAIVVFLLANWLPGVSIESYLTAIIVAVVLGLLNLIVKPILVLFTLPVTILTLGLFLLVINALIILLCDYFIGGFAIAGFWYALLFSVLLSIVQSILFSVLD
ncbi:MAG TPA: phage holin family protein [Flavobacteriaceae bacterium]|nr:phage holin family protein [Flavobacteriaceae bacterium]